MPELLCALIAVLVIITVIGHGIWVLFAKVIQLLQGGASPVESESTPPEPQQPFLDRREIASQEIRRLQRDGRIDVELYLQLQRALYPERIADPSNEVQAEASPAEGDDSRQGVLFDGLDESPDEQPAEIIVGEVAPSEPAEVVAPAMDAEDPHPPPSHDVLTPQDRVQQYVQSREREAADAASHSTSASTSATPEAVDLEPQRTWNEWLGAFMEEKNIRWGEVVGGLLIVSCSIALVISFWSTIAERPFLKFGVLNAVTASLFGFGLHVAHNWRLPSTSRGILITSCLLAPLNFLAIAAFSESTADLNAVALFGEGVSILLLGTLVYFGGRVITPGSAILLTIGVMVPAINQLVLRRFVSEGSSLVGWYAFALIATGSFAVTQILMLHPFRKRASVEEDEAARIFKQLGVVLFSVLVGLGLLLVKTEQVSYAISWLSPLSLLVATPLLVIGIALWRRPGVEVMGWRLAGTSLAVAGVLLMVGAVVMGWPQPVLLAAIGLLCFACFSWIAEYWRTPELHAAAAVFLALTGVTLFHVAVGELPWTVSEARETLSVFTSAASGHTLTVAGVVLSLAALGLRKMSRPFAAFGYQIVAAGAAGIGLLLIAAFGAFRVGDPEFFTWYLAAYGLAAAGGAVWLGKPAPLWVGGGLLLAASLHGVYFAPHDLSLAQPATAALLIHASTMAIFALAVFLLGGSRLSRDDRYAVEDAALNWMVVSSVTAAFGCLVATIGMAGLPSALNVAWVAAGWLFIAWRWRSIVWFTAFQVALAGALMTFVDQRLQLQTWYVASPRSWIHPTFVQWQAIALAGLGIAWGLLRIAVAKVSRRAVETAASRAFEESTGSEGSTEQNASTPDWEATALATSGGTLPLWTDWLRARPITVDRVALHIAVGALVGLTTYGLLPGVAQELSPRVGEVRIVRAAADFQILGLPHAAAQNWRTWLLLAVIVIGYAVHAVHRYGRQVLTGAAIATAMIPLLLATQWESDVAVASATRWNCAIYFLAVSVLIWMRRPILNALVRRGVIQTNARRRSGSYGLLLTLLLSTAPIIGMVLFVAIAALSLEPPSVGERSQLIWFSVLAFGGLAVFGVLASVEVRGVRAGASVGGSLLVLSIMPIAAMTLFVVGQSLAAHPVTGPEAGSLFVEAGLAVSYAVPLGLISLAFIGHAIHLRSSPVALAAGLVVNLSATAAYLLTLRSGSLAVEQWVTLSLFNSTVASTYVLGWLVVLRRLYLTRFERQLADPWLLVQRGVGLGFILVPIVAFTVWLWMAPEADVRFAAVGGWLGWSGLLLLAAAPLLEHRLNAERTATMAWPLWLVWMAFLLSGLQVHAWETGPQVGSWLAYHGMQLTLLSAGLITVTTQRQWLRWIRSDITLPEAPPIVALVLFGLRGIGQDPGAPWWPMMALLGAAGLCIELAARTSRQRYLAAALGLINLSISLWWIQKGNNWGQSTDVGHVLDFLTVNSLALALPIPLWLFCTRRSDAAKWQGRSGWLAVAAGWLSVILVALCLIVGLFSDLMEHRFVFDPVWRVLGLLAAGYAGVSLLWSRRRQAALALLWITGLLYFGAYLDVQNLSSETMLWIGTSILSAYGLLASYLWSYHDRFAVLADRLKLPPAAGSLSTAAWLLPVSLLLTMLVCLLGHLAQFSCDFVGIRITASQAILVQVWAVGLLSQGLRNVPLRYTALCVGVIGAVAFGWAWLDPNGDSGSWLNRVVMLSGVLMGMAALYAIGLVKILRRQNEWTEAAQQLTPILMGLGSLTVVGVLLAEAALFFGRGEVAMAWPAILAVSVALVATATACLAAAIIPGRDPLGLSDNLRTVYVYAAEAALALLLFHLRMTMPYLFTGFFARYWTIIVMVVAYLGIGLSEWFQRRRQQILASPLERTALLLPLAPLIGFWVGEQATHYSLLLFAAGGLYATMSIMRKSFGMGVLATLAANSGLWYFLQTTAGIQIYAHPQLWLIPPAVCVLAAAYLNREQLDAKQMTTIRYLATSVIYVASTADVFLNGVGEAPWLPVVLAGLSILGVMAGILMRVRAFLFMGLAFLVVSLMTVIWHAAVDLERTWVWYVTGIVTGVLVFALFALFERKRQQVLQVVDQVKLWDA